MRAMSGCLAVGLKNYFIRFRGRCSIVKEERPDNFDPAAQIESGLNK